MPSLLYTTLQAALQAKIKTQNYPKISNKKSAQNSSRNSPEITPETTSNDFPENISDTTKKGHPDEDVDPFKLFNIPKQNVETGQYKIYLRTYSEFTSPSSINSITLFKLWFFIASNIS